MPRKAHVRYTGVYTGQHLYSSVYCLPAPFFPRYDAATARELRKRLVYSCCLTTCMAEWVTIFVLSLMDVYLMFQALSYRQETTCRSTLYRYLNSTTSFARGEASVRKSQVNVDRSSRLCIYSSKTCLSYNRSAGGNPLPTASPVLQSLVMIVSAKDRA